MKPSIEEAVNDSPFDGEDAYVAPLALGASDGRDIAAGAVVGGAFAVGQQLVNTSRFTGIGFSDPLLDGAVVQPEALSVESALAVRDQLAQRQRAG